MAFCDGVERGSENVALAVLRGVGVTENATLRKELSRTVKHMKKLTAKFSAAGFFNVDQRLSNALYTSVIAYLIIVIQFRGPDERAGDGV